MATHKTSTLSHNILIYPLEDYHDDDYSQFISLSKEVAAEERGEADKKIKNKQREVKRERKKLKVCRGEAEELIESVLETSKVREGAGTLKPI